jgi:hypothetical protein
MYYLFFYVSRFWALIGSLDRIRRGGVSRNLYTIRTIDLKPGLRTVA